MEPQRFLVLLTHSSRPVDFSQCGLEEIRARYAAPDRLKAPPPLEALTSLEGQRHYTGGLSLLELVLTSRGVALHRRSFLEPGYKVQHATLVDGKLVLCFEDALMVLDRPFAPLASSKRDERPDRLIIDPWFAGMHTAFQSGPGVCVVSASSPDAVLTVDLEKKAVVQRRRLPESVYGLNYDLAPSDSLRDHYIHNDLQIAHLNCAWPAEDGSIYVSTLIQGDIGRFANDGTYRVLRRGDVGCHAAKLTPDGRILYFADSCHGRLVTCDPEGDERGAYDADSAWLHDVQHVVDDLFLLCAADRNALMLVDVANASVLMHETFEQEGKSVQFVSIHRWNNAAFDTGS